MPRCNIPPPLRFNGTFVAYVQRHANLQARPMAAMLRVKSLQAGLSRDRQIVVRGALKTIQGKVGAKLLFWLYNINFGSLSKRNLCLLIQFSFLAVCMTINFKTKFETRCLRPQCFKSLLCQTQKGCTACYLQHLAVRSIHELSKHVETPIFM